MQLARTSSIKVLEETFSFNLFIRTSIGRCRMIFYSECKADKIWGVIGFSLLNPRGAVQKLSRILTGFIQMRFRKRFNRQLIYLKRIFHFEDFMKRFSLSLLLFHWWNLQGAIRIFSSFDNDLCWITNENFWYSRVSSIKRFTYRISSIVYLFSQT